MYITLQSEKESLFQDYEDLVEKQTIFPNEDRC